MFIYSTHYYVFPTTIKEENDWYFIHDKIEDYFSEMEGELEYFRNGYDFVNMAAFEIESYDMMDITMGLSRTSEKKILRQKIKDSEFDHFYKFGEIKNKRIDGWLFYDTYYYTSNTDPFVSPFFIQGFQKFNRKRRQKKNATVQDIYYEDEDIFKNPLYFPNENLIYYLDRFSFARNEHYLDYDDFEEPDFNKNMFVCIDWCLDDDSYEYWYDLAFNYKSIREMHDWRERRDFYHHSFLTPLSKEWFDKGLWEYNIERYTL